MTGGSRRLRAKPAGRGGVAGESELTRQRNRGGVERGGGWGGESAESRPPRSICILSTHGPMRSGREAARAADWLAAGGGEGQVGRGGAGGEGAANGARRRAGEERPNRRACARMRFTDEEMHAHGPRAFAASPGPLRRRRVANQTARLAGATHAQVNGDVTKWRKEARVAQSPTLPVTASIPQDETS